MYLAIKNAQGGQASDMTVAGVFVIFLAMKKVTNENKMVSVCHWSFWNDPILNTLLKSSAFHIKYCER